MIKKYAVNILLITFIVACIITMKRSDNHFVMIAMASGSCVGALFLIWKNFSK